MCVFEFVAQLSQFWFTIDILVVSKDGLGWWVGCSTLQVGGQGPWGMRVGLCVWGKGVGVGVGLELGVGRVG